jgi:hypothetical protein
VYGACREQLRKLFALADVLGWEDEGLHCEYAIPDPDYFLALSADYCDILAESVAYEERTRKRRPGEGSPESALDLDQRLIAQDKHATAILRAMLRRSSRE